VAHDAASYGVAADRLATDLAAAGRAALGVAGLLQRVAAVAPVAIATATTAASLATFGALSTARDWPVLYGAAVNLRSAADLDVRASDDGAFHARVGPDRKTVCSLCRGFADVAGDLVLGLQRPRFITVAAASAPASIAAPARLALTLDLARLRALEPGHALSNDAIDSARGQRCERRSGLGTRVCRDRGIALAAAAAAAFASTFASTLSSTLATR
jgi:hypothetical protein